MADLSTLRTNSPVETREQIDAMAILRLLWRGKWLIFLTTAAGILLGGYYAYGVAQSQYKTSAILRIELSDNSVLDITELVSGSSTDIASMNTEIKTIETREMMEALVRALNLTEDPEFNPARRPAKRFTPVTTVKRFLGLIGPKPVYTPEEQAAREFRRTTSTVKNRISVSVEPETYLFRISGTSLRPRRAAELANTLAELHIDSKFQEKVDNAEASISWLSERVKSLESELREQEDAVKVLKAETSLISREALEALNLQAKEFRDRLQSGEESLTRDRITLEQLTGALARDDRDTILDLLPDPALRRAANTLGPDLSGEENARQLFMARLNQLLSQQRSTVLRRENEVQSIAASLDRIQLEIGAQSRDLQILDQLERELRVTQDLYQTFLTGLQEVSMQVGLVRPDTKLMSRALPPQVPFAPRRSVILLLSAFLGALFASVVLLVRELLRNNIRSPQDIAAVTSLPVLASLPKLRRKERHDILAYYRDNPASPATEALRNLRTTLLIARQDTPPQVMMVTSALPGEGKTTLSLSLGLSLATMNKRVLVLEADIRRRPFHNYFPDAKPRYSLQDVIEEPACLEEALYLDKRYGFYVLFGAKSDVNAADLFSSQEFAVALDKIRGMFDYVVIDTPPVMVVPDARIIAANADCVLMAVRWDMITPAQLRDSLQQFESVPEKVYGTVLTQVDFKRMQSYGYGYSGYGYGYGYGSKKSYDI